MNRLLGIIILLFSLNTVQAQELSTLGKTFWLTFMENRGGLNGCSDNSTPQLKIVISCNKATTGTVKNPIFNVSMPFSIGVGGGVDTVLVPASLGYVTGSEASSSRSMGLLVQSNDTISVSAQNTKAYSCDASLIYPIEALGVEYRVFSHMGDQAGNCNNYKSCFVVVATQDNTTVDITPSCQTTGGKPANTKFSVTLNRGETYMVMAGTNKLDLSGTLVEAKDCKVIAVFGGSTRSSVLYGANNSCGNNGSSYDQLYEELMPVNLWGKKFIVIPTIYTKNKQRRADMIRVVASQNNTAVRVNGKLKVLSAGQADTFFIATDAIVLANKPIGLCQYGLSEACDGVNGGSDTDPMMMWVSPLEQSLKEMSFSCENAQTINKFFLNVIVKTANRSTFTIDNAAPTGTWKLVAKDTSYSYLQQDGLTVGKHNMKSPYGFAAILYAYGDHGSFGYNAGSSIKPLSFYSVVNGKSSADFESDSLFYSVCEDATIPFDGGGSNLTGVTWKWLLYDKNNSMLSGFPKQFKSFSYTFNDTGTYRMVTIAQRPTNGTCNGLTSIDDSIKSEVRVYKKPDIHLLKDTTICRGNSFYLTSITDGDTNYVFYPSTWLSCTNCYQPLAKPEMDTTYMVYAIYKGCTPSRDTFKVKIRDSIFMDVFGDTTICRGTSTTLSATAKGGLSSNLTVTWDHGLGNGLSKVVSPKTTTTYRAILTDGCTKDANGNLYADTGYVKIIVRDSLKITMPKDTLVCEGNDVTLTVSIKGGLSGASLVTWDNGLGNGLSKTVNMGSSDVTYKAVLSDGCTLPKDSGYVTVKVRPGLVIDTILFNSPVCKNQVFKVSARAHGGDSLGYIFKLYNTTYFNDLIDSAKGLTYPSFNIKVPDDQTFSLKINQTCNSQQISKKFSVKIKTGLNITNPTPVDTICTGRSYTLNINGVSADMQPIKFVLKRKNGAAYVAVDSMTHANTGTFVIKPTTSPVEYLIIGNDNCSRNDSATFKLITRAPLAVNALSDDELCRNESKSFTAVASGGRAQSYSYRWYEVSNNNTLGNNANITYIPTNTMDIGVEVRDGCSDSVKTTARLWVAPVVTDSVLATTIDGCEPLSTVFFHPKTLAQSPNNPSFTWKWYFDGANSVNNPSSGGMSHNDINRNYQNAGIYNTRVDMVLSNNKICFSKNQVINVYEQAIADFSYLPRQVDIVEPEVSFTNLSVGATAYNWNFGDGNTDNSKDPLHIYTDTGLFIVTMVASNINGCNDTTDQFLRVLDIYRIFIPDAFSPNKDEFNTVWEPKFTSILTLEVTIFNRWGEKIYFNNDNTGRWDGTYQGADVMEGVYYYHIKVRDNRKKWHYYSGIITLIR